MIGRQNWAIIPLKGFMGSRLGDVVTSNKNLGLAGAAVLIVGLFCPIVTLPFLGNVNIFNDGTNLIALVLLAIAVIGGAMALNGREHDTLWPGVAGAVILVYHFATLQYRLSQIRSSMDELKDNPFAGLAKTAVGAIQLQWGWLVLAAGAGLLVYAGIRARRELEQPLTALPDSPAKTVAGISTLLAVGVIGWTIAGATSRRQAAIPARMRQACRARYRMAWDCQASKRKGRALRRLRISGTISSSTTSRPNTMRACWTDAFPVWISRSRTMAAAR
ncbi:hypothetical protein GCM10020258_27300 [Sphingomonas yabuuchiae]